MTPEKEIEIMKWLVDNYPNHETNCVKIWELIKIINHYHESEVKKLNIPAVIKSVCENCGKDEAVICQNCYDIESQFRECY